MAGPEDEKLNQAIEITAEIVAAYVSKNSLSAADLPKLIGEVFETISRLGIPQEAELAPAPTPAVSIRKSITSDYLICLDDGKPFKSLKRHLAQLGMTPHDYRAKWGLPSNYPMVAPNYAATRSALAKTNGLGRRAPEPEPEPQKRSTRNRVRTPIKA